MDLIVRAYPIPAANVEDLRRMAATILKERADEAVAFYARYGVSRETWHLQQTPHGWWVIGVTEVRDQPVAVVADRYKQSEEPFDRWFKNQVHAISGINPDEEPLGPPTECLFDTAALAGAPPGAAVKAAP
jgi:hypothetical protein